MKFSVFVVSIVWYQIRVSDCEHERGFSNNHYSLETDRSSEEWEYMDSHDISRENSWHSQNMRNHIHDIPFNPDKNLEWANLDDLDDHVSKRERNRNKHSRGFTELITRVPSPIKHVLHYKQKLFQQRNTRPKNMQKISNVQQINKVPRLIAISNKNRRKSNKTSRKANKTRGKSNKTWRKSNKTRGKSNKTRGKSNKTKRKSNKTRWKSNKNSRKANKTRGKSNKTRENPTKQGRNPTKLRENPTKLERNPIKIGRNPIKLEKNPTKPNNTKTEIITTEIPITGYTTTTEDFFLAMMRGAPMRAKKKDPKAVWFSTMLIQALNQNKKKKFKSQFGNEAFFDGEDNKDHV